MLISKLKKSLPIAILGMVSVGLIQGCQPAREELAPEGRPILTPAEVILPLYQMVKDTHELFNKHGITYWADGGTLIGALRHKGVIPWDDDADLCLLPGDEKKILTPEFEHDLDLLGYYLVHHEHAIPGNKTWSIYPKGKRVAPMVDLFQMTEIDDRIEYTYAVWGKRNGHNMHYAKDEVGTPKKVPFGETVIMVPAQAREFVSDYYGPTWENIGVQSHTHRDVPGFKPVKFELTDEDRKPAGPTGPLKDRTTGVI